MKNTLFNPSGVVVESVRRNPYSFWGEKKDKFKIDCCQICMSEDRLALHHLYYRHLLEDDENNLITLCCHCHKYIHFDKKRKTVRKEWDKRMHKLMEWKEKGVLRWCI